MARFGAKSKAQLDTLHPGLRAALEGVIPWLDFSVREGYRSDEDQQTAYDAGVSNAKPGESLHNRYPSWAVDVYPYPLSQTEFDEFAKHGRNAGPIFARFAMIAAAVTQAAREGYIDPKDGKRKFVELRWGADWDMDEKDLGAGFNDSPHIEIVRVIE